MALNTFRDPRRQQLHDAWTQICAVNPFEDVFTVRDVLYGPHCNWLNTYKHRAGGGGSSGYPVTSMWASAADTTHARHRCAGGFAHGRNHNRHPMLTMDGAEWGGGLSGAGRARADWVMLPDDEEQEAGGTMPDRRGVAAFSP